MRVIFDSQLHKQHDQARRAAEDAQRARAAREQSEMAAAGYDVDMAGGQ